MINDHLIKINAEKSAQLNEGIQAWLDKGNEIKKIPIEQNITNNREYQYNSKMSRLMPIEKV